MNDEQYVNLGAYVHALRRWFRFILLCGVVGAALGLIISLVLPPTYEAEARVSLVRAGTLVDFDTRITTVSELSSTGVDQTARRRGLTTLAEDADLAASVIATLGSKLGKPAPTPAGLLSVMDVVADGDVLRIRAQWTDGPTAALIANTWAAEYERRMNAVYAESPVTAADVAAQAKTARQDYDKKQTELAAFIKVSRADQIQRQIAENSAVVDSLKTGGETGRSYLDSLIAARKAVLDQQAAVKSRRLVDLYTLENQIDRLLTDAANLRARLAAGSLGTRGDELAVTLLEASVSSGWASLPVSIQVPIDQLAPGAPVSDTLRRVEVLASALADRRKVVDAEIHALSKDMVENAGAETRDAQLQALEKLTAFATANTVVTAAVDKLGAQVNELRSQAEEDQARRRELTQARDLAWTTYTSLAGKVSEIAVAEQGKAAVVRVASQAPAPSRPVAPRLAQNVLLSLLLGLVLAIVIVLLRQFGDHSFRSAAEAASGTGLAVLSAMPRRVLESLSTTPEMGILRHRLLSLGEQSKTVLVTSAGDDADRKRVAEGLSAALAAAGRSVILIDADTRRGLGEAAAALQVLAGGQRSWRADLVAGDANPGLRRLAPFALPTVPADTAAFLASESVGRLLADMASDAEHVVLIGPPVLGAADALALAPRAGSTIMVARAGVTQRPDLLAARRLLEEAGARLAGLVLTGVRPPRGEASAGLTGSLSRLASRLVARLGLDADA